MSLGRTVAMIGAAFCLTLAIIIVQELSSDALAVAIGVGCGVAAGIPATLLLYAVLSRRDGREQDQQHDSQQREYPPVIIVQGHVEPQLPYEPWPASPEEGRSRSHVRLVGGEDLLPGEGQENRG